MTECLKSRKLWILLALPTGVRTRLFRLKSRAKFKDINVRFDSSCNVPVMEDQFLGDESKCDCRSKRPNKLHRATTPALQRIVGPVPSSS